MVGELYSDITVTTMQWHNSSLADTNFLKMFHSREFTKKEAESHHSQYSVTYSYACMMTGCDLQDSACIKMDFKVNFSPR